MRHWILLSLLFSSALCAQAPLGLAQLAVGSGYAFGTLRSPHTHYRVQLLYLRSAWSLKRCFAWNSLPGDLLVGLEPSANIVINPCAGVELAGLVMLHYVHPCSERWRLEVEAGTGPGYLSIDTRNQGQAGFNFLNQGGGAVHYLWNERDALSVGYRYRHMSHGNVRSGANSGIDSHAFALGMTRFY